MGKGSSYRPVDRKAYGENYDRIFAKKSNVEYNTGPTKETVNASTHETPKQATNCGEPSCPICGAIGCDLNAETLRTAEFPQTPQSDEAGSNEAVK